MALRIIVSYDDTDNDRDALALGRLLAVSGAELSLAYVRHSQGGALEQKEADELLARGAASLGAPDMSRHVVVNPGTSVGLAELAERENADIIVFGSEYRTADGHGQARDLGPQTAARRPGGDRRRPGRPARAPLGAASTRSASSTRATQAARETADSLAAALGASVAEFNGGPVDLLVVGSRPESPRGEGHAQRLQRLRGRGRDLPGPGGRARRRAQLRRASGSGRLTASVEPGYGF